MSDLTILIPAAGASSRMRGQDKLLIEIAGTPLLRRTAERALAAHSHLIVTLRPTDAARRDALAGLPIRLLTIPDADQGLSASLRAGGAAINRGGVMVLPADMPDITVEDLRRLIAAHQADPGSILRASAEDGTPGHPVLFPADLLPAFATLTGDQGARSILQAHQSRLRLLALPGQNALTDLDTPEAWATWRRAKP